MGDRAIIIFKTKDEVGAQVYLHHEGSLVKEYLKKLAILMKNRRGDVEYSTARFIGLVCADSPEASTGIGVSSLSDKMVKEVLKGGSPNSEYLDNGVFIVDANTFKLKQIK